jgi:hypothetical protein
VHAKHVDLERPPPVLRLDLPGGAAAAGNTRIGDEQIDRPVLGNRSLDRITIADIKRDPTAADLVGDCLDLPRGARGHDDVPAVLRELAGDVRPDPTPPTGHECDHAQTIPPTRARATRAAVRDRVEQTIQIGRRS